MGNRVNQHYSRFQGFVRVGTFLRLPVLLLSIAFLSNCSKLAPKVSAAKMSAAFDHTGVTTCIACHIPNRPTTPVGNPLFDHSQGGTGDCATCHMAVASNIGVSWAGGVFAHSLTFNACISCHTSSQWPTSAGPFNSASGSLVALFPHSTQGSGDCVTCHQKALVNITSTPPVQSWVQTGTFTHTAATSACIACHTSAQWPSGTGPFIDASGSSVTFNHLTQGTGDCSGCHQKALQNALATPMISSWVSTGLGYPNNLAANTGAVTGSTDVSVTTDLPSWGGTFSATISSVTQSTIAVPQTMNHNSIEVTATQLQSCATCHTDAATGNYKPGFYHSNVVTQPVTCGDCHGAGTLYPGSSTTNGMPQGLVGPAGNSRSPSSGEMNHFAMNWTLSGSTWSRGATNAFKADCNVCHASGVASSWGNATAPANFHTSLASANPVVAQPTSCLDCHANNRPSGLVPSSPLAATPTQFDHTNGQGDCVTCHAAPNNTTATTPPSEALWANGVFHAKAGVQTSCDSCHNTQRPTSTAGWLTANFANYPFDQTNHGNGLDCVTCHTASTTFTSMAGWENGHYTHAANLTSCSSCHTTQMPTSTGPFTDAGGNVIASFAHTVNGKGIGECAGCHAKALTNVITHNASPSSADWVSTGTNGTPPGPTGTSVTAVTETTLVTSASPLVNLNQVTSTSSATVNLVEQMLHSSTAIPSSHWAGGVVGSSLTCTDCHTGGIATPTDSFHYELASPTTLWPNQPTTCKDCHLATMPTNIVGPANRYMDHAAVLSNGTTAGAAFNGSGDCFKCHTQPGVVGNWLAYGSFHSNIAGAGLTPNNCTTCHYLDVSSLKSSPTINGVNTHMMHASAQVTQDCATCHTMPTAAQIATSGYPVLTPSIWSGGIYHGKITTQPTACNDCHSSEKPTMTTQSLVDASSPSLEFMSHTSQWASSKDCSVCHLETKNLAAGTSPTAFSRTSSFHTGVSSGVTTCQECHGLTNGNGSTPGTGNTIPAAITTTSNVSAVGNVGAVITPEYSSPASGSPIYDMVDHADYNVSSRDCATCHTPPAANAGADYTQWQSAKFHTKVTTVDTSNGKCANCHYNLMPNASFTGYDHTKLISATGSVTLPNGLGKITSDCSSCHTQDIGTDWLKATATGHTQPFGNCAGCHGVGGSYKNDLPPTTTWYSFTGAPYDSKCQSSGGNKNWNANNCPGGYNHDPADLGQTTLPDCMTCHTQTAAGIAGVGVTWSQTGFISHSAWTYSSSHNNGSTQSCSPCHSQNFSSSHENASLTSTPSSQACAACHSGTMPTASGTAPTFGGNGPSGC